MLIDVSILGRSVIGDTCEYNDKLTHVNIAFDILGNESKYIF